MFTVPTAANGYRFKKVFEEFNSEKMLMNDRLELMRIFLEPQDSKRWSKKDSSTQKQWFDSIVRISQKHPECESWTAKKVTTVVSPIETRVGHG